MDSLSNFLVESDALLETIKPPSNLNINHVQLKDYSIMQIKLMLMDLFKAVEKSEQHYTDTESTVNSTNEPLTNSQTVISHDTPIIPSTVISQNRNPTDVNPITNNNNYLINSGMVPMHNNDDNDTNLIDTNKRKREEEDKNRLRRKYNNKYRYLNMTKNVLSNPNAANTVENVQNSNKLPKDENNVRIFVVSNDNSNLSDCKTVFRSVTLQPRVLINKFDKYHQNNNSHPVPPEIRKYI